MKRTQLKDRQLPDYTRGEEIFNMVTHIVGGGLAGSAAAYTLAKAGVKVIVIERGETCGCKNMTGGRLYGHSL